MNKSDYYAIVTKSVLILTSVLLFQLSSFAQIGLGIESGLNFFKPHISHSSAIYAKSDVNTYLGLSPYYKFSQRMSIVLEVKYSRLGFRSVHFNQIEKKNKYNYLSIAKKFEYKVHPRIAVGLGMYYSGLLSSQNLNNGVWESTSTLSPVLKADIGLIGSMKYVYKKFYWTLGYQFGLQDINSLKYTDGDEDGFTATSVNYDLYTRNIQIGVGYILKI